MGRPKVPIDLDEVARLAGLGLSQEQICSCIGISRRAMVNRKKISPALVEAMQRGKAAACEQVANWLFELCEEKNLGAIVWFEKTRAGLNERVILEGNSEKPIVLAAGGNGNGAIAAFAPGPVGDSDESGEGEDGSSRKALGQNGSGSHNGHQ